MTRLYYKKMSLFDAPKGSYLARACNTDAAWDSNMGAEFKERFPHAYEVHARNTLNSAEHLLGQFWVIWDNDYNITSLMVSHGYGKARDPKEDILARTEESLLKLLKYITETNGPKVVYSNRLNANRFAISWPETETILQKCLDQFSIEWVVCDPDSEGNNG